MFDTSPNEWSGGGQKSDPSSPAHQLTLATLVTMMVSGLVLLLISATGTRHTIYLGTMFMHL